ncbi:hypothetical protein VP249E411_P0131 [Vibrio phage 249E41-1]|nr:hypothetical protein VP249E411_P0131 [Vibrio phage 249E41-1]CAH9017099.1 hypothetical protein VP193E371_P0129 [Vibrio phage 193E37-1]
MFKFEMGQRIKVMVLNVMTYGFVSERILKENVYGTKISYGVTWNDNFYDRVSPTERQLELYQEIM